MDQRETQTHTHAHTACHQHHYYRQVRTQQRPGTRISGRRMPQTTNTSCTAPGKRIALPTRVEPKVFFANERTFLSWLNFTVILGSLAIGLLNFGDKVGRISASLFTLLAMGTMVYALITYHWRANAIRRRGSGPYDDRFGPTMLCFFLLIAVIVNFILRIRA